MKEMKETIAMVDLWSLFWHFWFARGEDPDTAAAATTGKVRQWWKAHEYMAIACSSQPSWREPIRVELGRPAKEKPPAGLAALAAVEKSLTRAQLLKATGMESVDMIASAIESVSKHYERQRRVAEAPQCLVYSDKDFVRQLARERAPSVEIRTISGVHWTEELVAQSTVGKRTDWPPWLALQWLDGIGPKKATEILTARDGTGSPLDFVGMESRIGQGLSLDHLPHSQVEVEEGFRSGKLQKARRISYLNQDAAVDVDRLLTPKKKRIQAPLEPISRRPTDPPDVIPEAEPTQPSQPEPPHGTQRPVSHVRNNMEQKSFVRVNRGDQLESVEWARELEPRSLDEAKQLAKAVMDSQLFAAYANPQAAFLVIMAGREFGLGTMASLRSFHIVEGRPCLSAQAMMGLCLRHHSCLYFRVVSATSDEVVVEAQRSGWGSPATWRFTRSDAEQAGLTSRQNWRKYPRAMLTNRCIAEASRFWFPDVVGGLYDPDEMSS